ncbi:MAG: hypothetical protein JXR88_15465 [Clostridia bacterium]|nr:hypothetical protein [Clostridia bacterium]
MNHKVYVKRVLSYIDCTSSMKKRLKEDIEMSIENRMEDLETDIEAVMGDPKSFAMEIIDYHDLKLMSGFEYISSSTFLGLPLVHITAKRNGIAKGIIAIGLRSIGVFSIGILSLGIFTYGVIGLGLCSAFGSVAISGCFSMGAIALSGLFSLGALSGGYLSIGALSFGKVAIGDIAYGQLALFKTQGYGNTLLSIYGNHEGIRLALQEHLNNSFIIDMIMELISVM